MQIFNLLVTQSDMFSFLLISSGMPHLKKKKQNKRIYISNTNKKEDTNMYSTKYYFFKKVEKMITELRHYPLDSIII